MKKKLLCCALLAGMSMAQSVMAQDYDDRFYVTVGAGAAFFDGDRNASEDLYGMIGFGRFITPNISIDAELWHTNPELDGYAVERNWELTTLSIVGRYHFIDEGRSWNPYLALGVGASEHHDGTQTQPLALGYNKSRVGTNLGVLVGVGIQKDLGYASMRAEIGAKFDQDDEGVSGNAYTDGYAGLSFLFPIGAEATAAPAPEPVVVVQKTCADLDDDSDGVNNCNDKCPGSVAGEAIGADGCPLPVAAPEPMPEPKPFRG